MYYEGGELRVDCVASNGCEIVRFGQISLVSDIQSISSVRGIQGFNYSNLEAL